jgi:hypothetical protein
LKIVINHLTRMMKGYICVAGLDQAAGCHVRPVFDRRLSVDLLEAGGGVVSLGSLVDLGKVRPCGIPPETEDVWFNPAKLRKVGELCAAEFWDLVTSNSSGDLLSIFGDNLQPVGQTLALAEGAGKCSLGCLRPSKPVNLQVDKRFNSVRAFVYERGIYRNLPVTDLRLYDQDYQFPSESRVAMLRERIAQGALVMLSVGLTRPFCRRDDEPPMHWLQVNNIHLKDDPLWDV